MLSLVKFPTTMPGRPEPSRVGSGYGKRGRVEPAVDGALAGWQIAVCDAVRKATDGLRVGWIRAGEAGRQVLAGLRDERAAQLPTADDCRHGTPVAQQPLAAADWQFPDRGGDETLARRVLRVASLAGPVEASRYFGTVGRAADSD